MNFVSPPDPHPWLGLDYRQLLPGLASGQLRFTLSLTRPRPQAYGEGVLRVVSVRAECDPLHCVLAYERYHIPASRGSSVQQLNE